MIIEMPNPVSEETNDMLETVDKDKEVEVKGFNADKHLIILCQSSLMTGTELTAWQS